MRQIESTFERAVYGHSKAKKALKQIVAQMIHGNLNSGYAFGFEGPPGVGKTSLAKYGLSECLKDEAGISRPFFMIPLGGDVNGSTLNGHHYTYLGSMWGSIVQILIDSKCMNPIILFDEVDKISKTESGKEIIGVLTHILDTTQNETFQDKYFNGIGIDLSKVIFILSYNDVSLMDKILLDRIKRIPFNALSSSEKLSICKSFFLPELLTMHGLVNKINISDTTLMHIIEVYTYESGCRKLKELLTQIVGMINLKMLESLCEETKSSNLSLPINVSVEDVDQIYLKLNPKIQNFPITNDLQTVGMVNCLYANDFGKGGVLKTTAKIIPASSFLELRLTGLLDGMMKESFEVSKTLAWDLLEENAKENFLNLYNSSSQKYGVHIHCGDGSISKSGTSAGVAITLLLYSIFNNKPISNRFAITGEVSLDGSVSEIGALEYKLLGGIKHGIKKFLFPSKNINDYHLFLETSQKENLNLESIQFFPIQTIQDAIKIIFY
jgi:ATP-dependent Lon protease